MVACLRRSAGLAAPCVLVIASLTFFSRRTWHGMRFSTFGDETMHIVGGQVIEAGGILYRDFIELHGPLIYAIPWAYGILFGWAEPLHIRIISIAFALCAALSVAASACLRGAAERMTGFGVFLGLISAIWIVQGLCMLDYQPAAGALLLVGLALFTLPAWFDAELGPPSRCISGLCFGLTPFLAFSYDPAMILIAASGIMATPRATRWQAICQLGAGALSGFLIMAVWMAWHADFLGYLVFHYIHGLVDFGPYFHFGMGAPIRGLWLPPYPCYRMQIMGEAAGAIGLATLILSPTPGRKPALPVILGALGLIMANPRGDPGFQNASFMILAFGVLALALAQLPRRAGWTPGRWHGAGWIGVMAVVVAGVEGVARTAPSSPHGYDRAQLANTQAGSLALSDAVWAREVRQVSAPGENILALPFWPDLYPLAGRPPMTGYVFYLPWDADYARHPWFGLSHDLCADLARTPPPVIYYNGWIVWNKYDPKHYMACLLPILATQYRPMPQADFFYVRTDRMPRLDRK
jgi:hypothetical protein